MKTHRPEYTHYGWLGLCPVYVGNIESDCPDVAPRHYLLYPLLRFMIAMQQLAIASCLFMDPYWEPTWSIVISGEIE